MSIQRLYTPAEAPDLAVQQVSLKHNNDRPALKKLMQKNSKNTFKCSCSLCRLSSSRGARKKRPEHLVEFGRTLPSPGCSWEEGVVAFASLRNQTGKVWVGGVFCFPQCKATSVLYRLWLIEKEKLTYHTQTSGKRIRSWRVSTKTTRRKKTTTKKKLNHLSRRQVSSFLSKNDCSDLTRRITCNSYAKDWKKNKINKNPHRPNPTRYTSVLTKWKDALRTASGFLCSSCLQRLFRGYYRRSCVPDSRWLAGGSGSRKGD